MVYYKGGRKAIGN
jgi:hypothetical protein